MCRAFVFVATFSLVFVGMATALGMQAPTEFDVASVKVNNSATGQSQISDATPGRFVVSNTPLRFIILHAYQLLDHQLIGAPDWTSSASFDINATYPQGRVPTDPEVRLMVQKLLADRFGLTAHREQRDLPMYALVPARKDGRLGPQLRRSDVDCQQNDAGKRPDCRMVATRRFLKGGSRTMGQLAAALQSMVGRPVVDRTGLAGAFDIDLQWEPTELDSAATGNPSSNGGPSIFTAVQEQLGLKLDSQRDRFDVLVVDHIERPGPN